MGADVQLPPLDAPTSVFAVMYIVPIMMVLISKATFLHNKLLELLGKSSYNIFLVQMVYYLAGDEIINKLCSIVLVRVILNILICCSVGIVFYFIREAACKRTCTVNPWPVTLWVAARNFQRLPYLQTIPNLVLFLCHLQPLALPACRAV